MNKKLTAFQVWMPVLALAFLWSPGAIAQQCGTLENHFGPWDYRDPDLGKTRRHKVEEAHFSRDTENLIRGVSDYIGGDIDYILHVFPNHHRALNSIARLEIRDKQSPVPHAKYTADCYFDRAFRFRPNDGTVRLIYAVFLSKKGQIDRALGEYEKALEIMPNSAEAHYNLGLLLTDLKQFDKAREHAHKAYSLGHPLPGLRNKLNRLGEWKPEDSEPASEKS